MFIMQKIRLYISIFLVLLFTAQNVFAQEKKKIKIGAGSLLEGYYSICIKLCRYISEANDGMTCEVVPT